VSGRFAAYLDRPLTLVAHNRNGSFHALTHTPTGNTRRPPTVKDTLG
jgi:hypothetical protein